MLKRFRRHFRVDDADKPVGEIDAAVSKRSIMQEKKVLISIVFVLLGIIGWFLRRTIGTIDGSVVAQAADKRELIAEAKAYTDAVMTQHEKAMQPLWNQVVTQDASIKQIGHDVQRITDFMEFKFGMPHDPRRRHDQ